MRGVFLCAANPTFFPDLLSDEDHEKDTLEDHEKYTLDVTHLKHRIFAADLL